MHLESYYIEHIQGNFTKYNYLLGVGSGCVAAISCQSTKSGGGGLSDAGLQGKGLHKRTVIS